MMLDQWVKFGSIVFKKLKFDGAGRLILALVYSFDCLAAKVVDFQKQYNYCDQMRFGFILKLLVLVISLTVVIYAMRSLRSVSEQPINSDSDNMLNLLVGDQQKPYNWCPQDVIKVEIYTENSELIRTLSSTAEVSAVCELMIGPVLKDQAKPFQFKTKLKAYSKSNEFVSLEMDSQAKVFQVKGMPFTSPNLNKALDRLTNP